MDKLELVRNVNERLSIVSWAIRKIDPYSNNMCSCIQIVRAHLFACEATAIHIHAYTYIKLSTCAHQTDVQSYICTKVTREHA